MSISDAFLSELRALNHNWRISKSKSTKSEPSFPINKSKSSEKSLDEPTIIRRSISKYRFWDDSQIEMDKTFADAGEIKHEKSIPWTEMTDEQKVMKRKEWKVEENHYHVRLPIDPIRMAFIDDWRNMKSGAEIWSPR